VAKRSQGRACSKVANMDIFQDVQCGLELGFFGGGKREPKQRHLRLLK
jgi:hypothetical protein